MAEGVYAVGGSVGQNLNRQSLPKEEFSIEDQGGTMVMEQEAPKDGAGPAYILSLSPAARKALATYREHGNKIAK